VAIQSFVEENMKSRPQGFRDAVNIITELKLLQLGNLGKTWDQIEASVITPKDKALIIVRNMMQYLHNQIKKEEPTFEMTPAYELAMIQKILAEVPKVKELVLS
jgi:hypothetical protein